MNTLRDRILGCIIGGAIGDYPGSAWENKAGPIAAKQQVRRLVQQAASARR